MSGYAFAALELVTIEELLSEKALPPYRYVASLRLPPTIGDQPHDARVAALDAFLVSHHKILFSKKISVSLLSGDDLHLPQDLISREENLPYFYLSVSLIVGLWPKADRLFKSRSSHKPAVDACSLVAFRVGA